MRSLALLLAVPAALLVTAGCGVDEDNVGDRYARGYCSQMKRCDRSAWESRWDDNGACRDAVADDIDDAVELMDVLGCELDGPEAGRLIRDMKGASCEEFGDGSWFDLDEVFRC